MVRPLILHSRFLAIPDEDKYDASPFPDFDDDSRVQQYLQDRRVIGVRLSTSDVFSPLICCSTILWYSLRC